MAAVERQEGDGEISLWAFFFPLHRFPALMKTSFIWPHMTEDGRGILICRQHLKQITNYYRGEFFAHGMKCVCFPSTQLI